MILLTSCNISFILTVSTPDPMSTSVAANLLEMGFTQERAREAILTVRRLRGKLRYGEICVLYLFSKGAEFFLLLP